MYGLKSFQLATQGVGLLAAAHIECLYKRALLLLFKGCGSIYFTDAHAVALTRRRLSIFWENYAWRQKYGLCLVGLVQRAYREKLMTFGLIKLVHTFWSNNILIGKGKYLVSI